MAGSVYAAQHRNPDFADLISPAYLKDPKHCPAVGPHGRRLLRDDGDDVTPTFFLQAAGLCTGVSIGGGALLALLALFLFKKSPQGMVNASVGLQVAIPATLALVALLSGSPAAAAPFALMAGVLGFTLYLYRAQLALVGRLLGISVRALSDQPGIIVAALGLQVLGLVVIVPLAGMMLLAFMNGHVTSNPARVSVSKPEGVCLDGQGQEVVCCTWQVDGWVAGYLAYTALITTWTTLLVFTVKMYTIAGATAQWYFAPVASGPPKAATLRSIKNALGPSFGSLCLASWMLTLIQYARAMLEKIRQEDNGFCAAVFTTCLDFLYSVLEAVTRFGVVRAAITGEGFMDSCHGAVDLLARNLLDTVGVWWLPGLILQTTAFMMSLAWGLITYGGSTAYWGGGKAAVASGVLVGLLSFVFAFITLAFINSVLLNMVDAVYVAFALDRDAAAVTRSDVHDVFGRPDAPWHKAPGAIIEQPNASYVYGAEAPSAPAPYPSPAMAMRM